MGTSGAPPTWGQGIRVLRGIRNMTQTSLAAESRVSQSVISNLESGSHSASDATRIRIAKALDIDPHILFPYIDQEGEVA